MFSLILTLTALGNLFNLFLVGILFTVSVARHHHISLIVGLLPVSRPQAPPAVLRHPRPSLGTPGRPQASPAVICGRPPTLFILMCPAVIPNTCRLYPPPQSLPTPYRLLIPPIVPRKTSAVLPSPLASPLATAITCVPPHQERPSL